MPLKNRIQPPYYAPYQVPQLYMATITQTGTNAPAAAVLVNELNENMYWLRESAGIYSANMSGYQDFIFTIQVQNTEADVIVSAYWDDALSNLKVRTRIGGTYVDGALTGALVIIRGTQIV